MPSSRLAGLAALTLAFPLAAQQQADTALAARLERAERQIEVLRQQLAEVREARVEPRSGNRVELSGRVLVNGFFNNGKVNNSDVPAFVLPPDPPGLPASAAGATVRQTQLALTALVPELAGGSFNGELDLDFFGGQQPSPGGRHFPLVRIRRVRAELLWPNAWVMFGQEAPPIAELNPSTLSQLGTPSFANAGNLWLWIPQVRVGAEAGNVVRVGVEAAALAATSAEAQVGDFATQPDRAERSRRPFAQARLRVRWDESETMGEISVGGHLGWLATAQDTLVASRAAAASLLVTATRYLELRAEVFAGRVLAGLGGGGIGQNFGAANQPVRAKGGWAQLNIKPVPAVEVGGGYGVDDPDDADLTAALTRLRNVAWEGHLHWRPGPLVLGLEFRRLETNEVKWGSVSCGEGPSMLVSIILLTHIPVQ